MLIKRGYGRYAGVIESFVGFLESFSFPYCLPEYIPPRKNGGKQCMGLIFVEAQC